MLIDLFPRAHARFVSLPLLGAQLEGFSLWLGSRGFSPGSIRRRVQGAPALENLLQQRGIGNLGEISRTQLLQLVPRQPTCSRSLRALVRSIAIYLHELGTLKPPVATPSKSLVGLYRNYLRQVRGLAVSTVSNHDRTVTEFLGFLRYDDDLSALRELRSARIEAFLKSVAARLGRASLQHTAARLRSFLRFLAGRGEVATGLDLTVDMPRVYRGELLPKALPWETVRTFLAGIDRTTAKGRRDYAMLLLVTTYGLRASEVAGLRLDDIGWRACELRIQRPKVRAPLVLPLTTEVGAALLDYFRHARPASVWREAFLSLRSPITPLSPVGVGSAFRRWNRRSGLHIPFEGPHCLRHSLALHLLRRNTSLTTIGNLLGHRSPHVTGDYLRLHADDLRAAALDLPVEKEVGP